MYTVSLAGYKRSAVLDAGGWIPNGKCVGHLPLPAFIQKPITAIGPPATTDSRGLRRHGRDLP